MNYFINSKKYASLSLIKILYQDKALMNHTECVCIRLSKHLIKMCFKVTIYSPVWACQLFQVYKSYGAYTSCNERTKRIPGGISCCAPPASLTIPMVRSAHGAQRIITTGEERGKKWQDNGVLVPCGRCNK